MHKPHRENFGVLDYGTKGPVRWNHPLREGEDTTIIKFMYTIQRRILIVA